MFRQLRGHPTLYVTVLSPQASVKHALSFTYTVRMYLLCPGPTGDCTAHPVQDEKRNARFITVPVPSKTHRCLALTFTVAKYLVAVGLPLLYLAENKILEWLARSTNPSYLLAVAASTTALGQPLAFLAVVYLLLKCMAQPTTPAPTAWLDFHDEQKKTLFSLLQRASDDDGQLVRRSATLYLLVTSARQPVVCLGWGG